MYRIKIEITGIAPLSMDKFTEEALMSLKTRKTGGKYSDDQRIAEVEQKVYRNEHGLFIPDRWLKAAMLVGCTLSGEKEGKRSLYPYLNGTVFIDPMEIPLNKKNYDFIYERPGRIPPKTGAAAIIRTPAIKEGWKASFDLVVTDDRRNASQLRTIWDTTGLIVGIGNNRPAFGRFMVTGWEVQRETLLKVSALEAERS